MSRNLATIYDAEFFDSYNEEQEADIRAAADVLIDVFRPGDVLDIGCGPGMMVRRFRDRFVNARGLDGSEYAIKKAHPSVRDYLEVEDITEPLLRFWPVDLVVCTEVAEHVPFEKADVLVDHLCAATAQHGAIVFTAAPPGQGGHDHCNEQPMHYWIEKFCARGLEVDEVLTASVKLGWSGLKRMWFYPANVRVFRRIQ